MSGIPSWARKGAKVVCVDGAPHRGFSVSDYSVLPVEGQTYTLEKVAPHHWSRTGNSGIGCWLAGVHRVWPFSLSRFRPLVEPKTEAEDLEHFKHHLTAPHSTTTVREGADA